MKLNSYQKILQSAEKIFSLKGYKATTIKEICDDAQINVSSISYHFGSKDQLYLKVINSFGETRFHEAERLLATNSIKSLEDFYVRLEIYLEDCLESVIAHPGIIKILQREKINGLPFAKKPFEDYYIPAFIRLISFFEFALEHNFIKNFVNPKIISYSLLTTIFDVAHSFETLNTYIGIDLSLIENRQSFIKDLMNVHLSGVFVPRNQGNTFSLEERFQ